MAKISGNFGSGQTSNGVVEILSPLAGVWRRPIEWGGDSSLGSDGVSVTFTNTNLPEEGQVVEVGTDGTADHCAALTGTETDLLRKASLGLVWTGKDQHDSGAVNTFTMIDGSNFLFDVSAGRVGSTLAAGKRALWDRVNKKFESTDNASGATSMYNIGVVEQIGIARGGQTFARIKWTR